MAKAGLVVHGRTRTDGPGPYLSHVWPGWRTALVVVRPETSSVGATKDFGCLLIDDLTRARVNRFRQLAPSTHTQFVLVREAEAVYAVTALIASVSFEARCLDVAVTQSPGFRDFSGSALAAGTWNLNVTYWRGDS